MLKSPERAGPKEYAKKMLCTLYETNIRGMEFGERLTDKMIDLKQYQPSICLNRRNSMNSRLSMLN